MTTMSYTLGHVSDVHLAPVALSDIFKNFSLKRLIGGMSWNLRRRRFHHRKMADALRADVLAQAPDHVCFTGDLVNISAPGEFKRGLAWLKEFGSGEWISFVPGNHDAYVPVDAAQSLGLFGEYFTSPTRAAEENFTFPFVRLRRNVAIIGLTSACPQPLYKAGGTLGARQLTVLATLLSDLGRRGFYRAVMIHHPPLEGLTISPRALTDANGLTAVLQQHGAELVMHGHNHRHMRNELLTVGGRAEVIGVPSASMAPDHGHDVAAWNLYRISRANGAWITEVVVRQWNAGSAAFTEAARFEFTSAQGN